jgi:hypothetical protein
MKTAIGLSIVAVLLSAAALIVAVTKESSQPRGAVEVLHEDVLDPPVDSAFSSLPAGDGRPANQTGHRFAQVFLAPLHGRV